MCESTVYIVSGSEKKLVMAEVARVLVDGERVTCVDTLGERRTVDHARISEANLVKHEIVLRPVQS